MGGWRRRHHLGDKKYAREQRREVRIRRYVLELPVEDFFIENWQGVMELPKVYVTVLDDVAALSGDGFEKLLSLQRHMVVSSKRNFIIIMCIIPFLR